MAPPGHQVGLEGDHHRKNQGQNHLGNRLPHPEEKIPGHVGGGSQGGGQVRKGKGQVILKPLEDHGQEFPRVVELQDQEGCSQVKPQAHHPQDHEVGQENRGRPGEPSRKEPHQGIQSPGQGKGQEDPKKKAIEVGKGPKEKGQAQKKRRTGGVSIRSNPPQDNTPTS